MNEYLLGRTHLKYEFAAFHYIIVHYIHLVVVLAVELHAAYIFVLGRIIHSLNHKLTSGHIKLSLVKRRSTEPEPSARRFNLIESERRKDVPCRHLTGILISGKSVRLHCIELIKHLTNLVGRLVGLSEHGIEIYYMVARLIAMGILADKTRNVGRHI